MKIKHLLFEISGSCNFNCRYCYFRSRKYSNVINLNKAKQIIYILKKKYDIQSIGFTGGEPLMRNDLFGILAYCKRLSIKTSIGTNGSLINEANVTKIKKYVNTVTVSIDGDESYFNWVTNSSAYNSVMRGLELLKGNGVLFGVHITVTPQNLEHLDPLLGKFRNLGARFVQIGDVQGTQAKTNKKLKDLMLNPNQLLHLYKIIKDYQDRDENFIKHVFISQKNLGTKSQWDKNIRKYFKPFFVVSPDGNLYPMVDVDNKWILCEDITMDEISTPKLDAYISRIPDLVNIAKKMLKKQDVISPYSIINDFL